MQNWFYFSAAMRGCSGNRLDSQCAAAYDANLKIVSFKDSHPYQRVGVRRIGFHRPVLSIPKNGSIENMEQHLAPIGQPHPRRHRHQHISGGKQRTGGDQR